MSANHKAKALTPAEKKWLKKLEAVMQECPSDRLQCYTIGDNTLYFYDKPHADAWEEAHPMDEMDAHDLHEKAGSRLGRVNGTFVIDSCAG